MTIDSPLDATACVKLGPHCAAVGEMAIELVNVEVPPKFPVSAQAGDAPNNGNVAAMATATVWSALFGFPLADETSEIATHT
jgi:hypothetical protein